MKSRLCLALAAGSFVACSSPASSTPGPGSDGGVDGATPPPTMHDGAVGADAPTVDGAPTPDAGGDVKPPPSDGGGDDASTCTPSPGAAMMTGECDLVELAILENAGGAAGVVLGGRVGIGGSPTMAPCALIDSIDIVQNNATIQTLTGTAAAIATDGTGGPWTTGTAAPALAQMCTSDASRFDGIGLVVHGRMDGGTFVTKCGNNTQDVGWPPRVVVSCHSGLTAPPRGASGTVQTFGAMAFDQLYDYVPAPPAVTGVDTSVHIIPGTAGIWGAMPMMPFDTTGWTANVSATMLPDGTPATSLSLSNMMDVLGMQLCPVPPPMPNPMQPPPPVFLARITGTTSLGPFMSELYVDFCARM